MVPSCVQVDWWPVLTLTLSPTGVWECWTLAHKCLLAWEELMIKPVLALIGSLFCDYKGRLNSCEKHAMLHSQSWIQEGKISHDWRLNLRVCLSLSLKAGWWTCSSLHFFRSHSNCPIFPHASSTPLRTHLSSRDLKLRFLHFFPTDWQDLHPGINPNRIGLSFFTDTTHPPSFVIIS